MPNILTTTTSAVVQTTSSSSSTTTAGQARLQRRTWSDGKQEFKVERAETDAAGGTRWVEVGTGSITTAGVVGGNFSEVTSEEWVKLLLNLSG